jgi:hypothetical protein
MSNPGAYSAPPAGDTPEVRFLARLFATLVTCHREGRYRDGVPVRRALSSRGVEVYIHQGQRSGPKCVLNPRP